MQLVAIVSVLALGISHLGWALSIPSGSSPALSWHPARDDSGAGLEPVKFETGNSSAAVTAVEPPDSVIQKRDSCRQDRQPYNMADMAFIKNDLQTNDPWRLVKVVQSGGTASWSWRTARICIRNPYLFDNTHVSRWEAGWAIGYITGMCCPGATWYVVPCPSMVSLILPMLCKSRRRSQLTWIQQGRLLHLPW